MNECSNSRVLNEEDSNPKRKRNFQDELLQFAIIKLWKLIKTNPTSVRKAIALVLDKDQPTTNVASSTNTTPPAPDSNSDNLAMDEDELAQWNAKFYVSAPASAVDQLPKSTTTTSDQCNNLLNKSKLIKI